MALLDNRLKNQHCVVYSILILNLYSGIHRNFFLVDRKWTEIRDFSCDALRKKIGSVDKNGCKKKRKVRIMKETYNGHNFEDSKGLLEIAFKRWT